MITKKQYDAQKTKKRATTRQKQLWLTGENKPNWHLCSGCSQPNRDLAAMRLNAQKTKGHMHLKYLLKPSDAARFSCIEISRLKGAKVHPHAHVLLRSRKLRTFTTGRYVKQAKLRSETERLARLLSALC